MSLLQLRETRVGVILGLLAAMLLASPASAQTITGWAVRVVRASVVLEQPRGDSIPVGSVNPGEVLQVLDRQGAWYWVVAPATADGPNTWQRGWVHADMLDVSDQGDPRPSTRGRFLIRGFAQAGGTLFTASNSFETILGNQFGPLFGGGVEVIFPNGVFVQGSFERFRETGSRAVVAGSQIFSVNSPERITVTPVQGTLGYRGKAHGGLTPFVGAGAGWYRLEEEALSVSAIDPVSDRHVGYHILGGVEYPLTRWVWLAGEAAWATVPDAIGGSGVSSVFGDDDLGGTTVRLKLIVGR